MIDKMGKRQGVSNRMFLRPSPNEETKLLQDEKQKLRRLRLQQVRQQEKVLASRARKKFKEKEKKEIDILENELKKKWQEEITEKKNMLESEYYENVAHVGEGHQAALTCEDGTPKERWLEDEIRASERYREALKKLREDDAEKAQFLNEKTEAKNKAMEIERSRAARVAALDPPVPDIAQNLETIQKQRYKRKNIDHYSSTYYHIPQELVERADPSLHRLDARRAAKEEEERLQNAKEESDRNFSEQMEKARLRHKHARSKLMLEKDHNKLLEELEHFERADRQRRQEIVSKIPKHVFEPPHRRIEANEERQREIEHAFEDMYMAQTNYMGDVTVAQEALPASPAVTDEESSVESEERKKVYDVQPDEDEENVGKNKVSDRPSIRGEGKRKFVEEAEKSRTDARPSSKDPLKRLLKKIDTQRDRWKSEMKTAKDIEERPSIADVIIPDNDSEISEGILTMTTENARSLSVESDAVNEKRKTLLHPHEEAERTRAASKYIHIPDATRKSEIEKQKEKLQQQKLKLQLQQQQVMQEHLQLQFDALNNEVRTKSDEEECWEDSTKDSPTADKINSKFTDLSSGVLSDDAKTISVTESVDEPGMSKSSEDEVRSDLMTTDDSRVNANVDRHDALHSIPESISEEDFVLLPPVSTGTISVAMPPSLPVTKSASTTSGVTKLVFTEKTRTSPPQAVGTAQHSTVLFPSRPGQPRSHASLDERTKMKPSLHISPPHVASPAASQAEEEAVPSSHTTHPNKQPATSVLYKDEPFLFPASKPPLHSENIPRVVDHRRTVISDSTTPFFHIPSTISSTPFVPEGPLTFQFPNDRETDTVSYLHFYQQQLLEQQNRIREQQKAIQERQQQRLEQLKQFQERLRRQRHDTGIGKPDQIGERPRQAVGQWQSLIPNARYPSDTDTSTSTDHLQSGTESVDRALSVNLHSDVVSPLKQAQLKPSTAPTTEVSEGLINGDTSSSLSRYPSEVIPIEDKDASLLPKTSDLGLWSDSTPQLSSSDATKNSSTVLEDSKSVKKLDEPSRPKVLSEFGLSSSSLSNNNNNGTASEMNSFNRSSERSSLKSGGSFGSGPLSLSSLPKSADKNISSGSSASDSNNNLLLQRMESSFQHFQEMIDEAKALNEKYVEETEYSRKDDLNENGSLENREEKDNVGDGYLDYIPRDKEYQISRQTNEISPGQLTEEQENTSDNTPSLLAHGSDDEFHEPPMLDQGSYKNDQNLLTDFPESNVENFELMKHFVRNEEKAISKESESRMFNSQMISNQENLQAVVQSPGSEIFAAKYEPSPSHYGSSPRALSVIPEESRVSDDDDLSEGMLESDEYHIEMPSIVANNEYYEEVPELNYSTDIVRHGDEEFQKYEESRNFVDLGSRQSISPSDHFTQPVHTSRNYFQNLSSPEGILKPSPEDRRQSREDNIPGTYENQAWGNLAPGEIMSSAEASKKFGLHVDLPTTEQRSYHEPSSSSLSMNDVVFSGLSSLSLSQTDESSTSGLSLQEAFRKRRPEFFKHSQERILQSKQARHQRSPDKKQQDKDADDDQNKASDPEKNTHKTPETTNPSLSQPSLEETVGKPLSDGRRKIGKGEMKDRTKRLYENLPDIRQKAIEKQRQETYAANRAKAQEFQKKTKERLRKLSAKRTGKNS